MDGERALQGETKKTMLSSLKISDLCGVNVSIAEQSGYYFANAVWLFP